MFVNHQDLIKKYLIIILQLIQKETQIISQKPTFQMLKYTYEQQKFLIIFKFHHSQIIQQEFEQLAEWILN